LIKAIPCRVIRAEIPCGVRDLIGYRPTEKPYHLNWLAYIVRSAGYKPVGNYTKVLVDTGRENRALDYYA